MGSKRKRRALVGFLAGVVVAILLAPFSGLLLVDSMQSGVAHAQSAGSGQAEGSAESGVNPRSNFWRAVREGQGGYSAVSGQETNVLINAGGENWRAIRNGPVATYGSWLMAGVAVALLLLFLFRGQVKIEGGRSGLTLLRWNVFERVLHWYVAILFVILMISGLSLLYGRVALIPVIGKDAFAAYAGLCKTLHNYLGPFFAAGLVLMLLVWLKDNIVRAHDLQWFAKGGGIIGKGHPSAGKCNGGEKAWYWLLVVVGLAMVASGLVLDFPQYGQDRGQMQLAHVIHAASSLVVCAFFLGHLYIGTIGTEGALEGMVNGRVDEQWAKQHHDLWFEELREEGVTGERIPSRYDRAPRPRSTSVIGDST